MQRRFGILHGPNLNWLGRREPHRYGSRTWEDIWGELQPWARRQEIQLVYFQSNHEGALIDTLQDQADALDGWIINPGALAHTSIALRDGAAALTAPIVEVHLSKLVKRERFRQHSYLSDVAAATISGFGPQGYFLGLGLLRYLLR